MSSPAADPRTRRFVLVFALVVGFLCFSTYLIGALSAAQRGLWYAGFQHATDDQMVYAAWMTQAQDGRLLMDNRFAVESQPGLTIHLYFFAVGLLSKFTGIGLAAAAARAVFSGLFVWLLYRFLTRIDGDSFFLKLGLILGTFGGGVGFLVWHSFGEAIVKPGPGPLIALLSGRLPIDVWQPEAFAFPSMLVNGLFVASLCLMLVAITALLDARLSWKPVPIGAAAMLLLMNVHSYDVLLLAIVAVAFLASQATVRTLSGGWIVRGAAIFSGAIPSAAWFLHVYREDAVFRARAATETFAPDFRQVLAGILLLAALAAAGLAAQAWNREEPARRDRLGLLSFGLLSVGLFAAASARPEGFWMDWLTWAGVFLAATLAVALLAKGKPAYDWTLAWAIAGLVAIYLPALFQRKLAMGLAIPWALLASLALYRFLEAREKGLRTLIGAASLVLLCLSSLFWFVRERDYVRSNVSRTTVQPVFYPAEVESILTKLRSVPGRKVVLAMPGIPSFVTDHAGAAEDRFATPYMPDLNPLASGFGGAYSYAGHWSETPQYLERRAETLRFFLGSTSPERREELLRRIGVTHVIAPVPAAFPDFLERTGQTLADVTGMGKTIAGGSQFVLLEVGAR